MTGAEMFRFNLGQRWHNLSADVFGVKASGMERTAGRGIDRICRLAP